MATASIFWTPAINELRLDARVSLVVSLAILAAGIALHVRQQCKARQERAAHIRKLFEQKWEWQSRERTKPRSIAEEYPALLREPTARRELSGSEIEINIATLRRAPSLFGDLVIKAALSDRPSERPLVQAELEGDYKIETSGFKYDLRDELPGRSPQPRF